MGAYVGTENAIVRAMGSGVTNRGRAILVAICDAATDGNRNPCFDKDNSSAANCSLTTSCLNLYKDASGCSASCL